MNFILLSKQPSNSIPLTGSGVSYWRTKNLYCIVCNFSQHGRAPNEHSSIQSVPTPPTTYPNKMIRSQTPVPHPHYTPTQLPNSEIHTKFKQQTYSVNILFISNRLVLYIYIEKVQSSRAKEIQNLILR